MIRSIFFVSFVVFIGSVDSHCIHGCTCHNHVLTCDCSKSNVTNLPILPLILTNAPRTVYISQCHTVHLFPWTTASAIRLQNIYIVNVEHLIILSNAFANLTNLHDLEIVHSNVTWKTSAMAGMDNVHHFRLYNVSSHHVPSFVFSNLTNIKEMTISDCTFGTIQSHAFYGSENFTRLVIKGTKVKTLESNAIDPISVEHLTISHVEIDKCLPYSLSPSRVTEFKLENSDISELKRNCLAPRNVKLVKVTLNTFGSIDSGAFSDLHNVQHLNVSFNTIGLSQKHAFDVEDPQMGTRTFYENSFSCNNVCWILFAAEKDKFYAQLAANSTCFEPKNFARKRLSDLQSLTDDSDVCKDQSSIEGSGDFPFDINDTTHDFTTVSPTNLHKMVTVVNPVNSTGNRVFFSCFVFLFSFSLRFVI